MRTSTADRAPRLSSSGVTSVGRGWRTAGLRCLVLATAALALAVAAPPVVAHTPHDIVFTFELSPDFAQDDVVFAYVVFEDRKLFARSEDGGRSWRTWGAAMASAGIADLAFSPDFATDGTAFAATLGEGVWRTTDGGFVWSPASSGLGSLVVRDLAPSPDFGTDGTALAATDAGVFVTTDGGDTWSSSSTGLADLDVRRLVRGGTSSEVYAAGAVLHRSADGGASWTALHAFADPVASLARSPADPSGLTLAASFGGDGGGVLVSTDGGLGFAPSNAGLTDLRVNDVVFADDGTLFAATWEDGGFVAAGLFASWTVSTAGLEVLSPLVIDHYHAVRPAPGFPADERVFLGGFEGFFTSEDGGTTWRQEETFTQRINRLATISPGFAEDGTLFVGNYGGGAVAGLPGAPASVAGGDDGGGAAPGVAAGASGAAPLPSPGGPGTPGAGAGRSTPTPAGPPRARWSARGNGIGNLYCELLALSPAFATDDTIFSGYNKLYRSVDRGLSWVELGAPASIVVVRTLGVSPTYPSDGFLLLGTFGEGTWRSDDGGDSWTAVGGGLPANMSINQIVFSPSYGSDGRIYLANKTRDEDGVWRSLDGGATWSPSGLPDLEVRTLEASPDFAADGTLFAGTLGEGMWVSTDGGDGWSAANVGLPAGEPLIVDDLAISPDFAADGTVFASLLSHGVWWSTDGGASWSPRGAGLPLDASRAVVVSPDFGADRTLFHTNHDWVWRSTDAGASWHRLGGALRVDERHQSVRYEGAWIPASGGGMGFGAGTRYTSEPGAATELAFEGDSVTWLTRTSPASAFAEVSIDGRVVATVDLYSPTNFHQQPVFREDFGAIGWHTIRIVNTGNANPASSNVHVHSDGFRVTF